VVMTSGNRVTGQMTDLDQSNVDTVACELSNVVVPRGPDMGCHVAPSH
jgi:hypothetical protein